MSDAPDPTEGWAKATEQTAKATQDAIQDSPQADPIEPELVKALDYAQELLDAAIDVLRAARVPLTENWALDTNVVGLTILCRSISNFRAAILLVQQEASLEAKALVRVLYENLLWLAALKERGIEFVEEMCKDEARNRKALGQLMLEINSTHGRGLTGPEALNVRSTIKQLSQRFPKPKKLNARETAVDGGVETVYCDYIRLSLEAVHCSLMTLGYHVIGERTQEKSELVLSVAPRMTSADELHTVLEACRALIVTARSADELIGCTTAGAMLAALEAEFLSNGWLERVLRPASTSRSNRAGSTRLPPGPH